MHLHSNAGIFERDVVSQRIIHIVYVVILGLQQERRRRTASDGNIGLF